MIVGGQQPSSRTQIRFLVNEQPKLAPQTITNLIFSHRHIDLLYQGLQETNRPLE
jgi:hypothetical protein